MSLPNGSELYLIASHPGGGSYRIDGGKSPLPEGTIQEGRTYVLELRNVQDPDHIDLILDDEILEALRSPNETTARWRWSPGFHAGVVEVRLKVRGSPIHRMEWTTDPDARKLTRDDFTLMVREILEDTYALFSLSSFRFGVARGSAQDVPPISRLEFLRSRVEAIESVVQTIAAKPIRLLKNQHAWVPYHRARALTSQDLVRSLAGRRVVKASNSSSLPPGMKDNWPAEVRVSARVTGYDIPEHRLIKASLRSWSEWLWSVGESLSALARADTLNPNSARWATRCRKLAKRLTELLQLPLFQEVADVQARMVISSSFRRVPAYRRFYSLYRDMNLGILNVAGDFLNLPLARTFDLYELWAYLRLARAAVELYDIQNLDATQLFRRGPRRNAICFASDAPILHLTPEVSLAFKRNYREYWLESDGLGSFSRTMQPDIAIRIGASPGNERRLIVIDAKYRVEKQLSSALASIHMYRDALVEENAEGGLQRSVIGAYLITPDQPDAQEDWRVASMPGRLFHPEYRSVFRFGAVTLRPGAPVESARVALKAILRDAGVSLPPENPWSFNG
jgi:hypothetical protein